MNLVIQQDQNLLRMAELPLKQQTNECKAKNHRMELRLVRWFFIIFLFYSLSEILYRRVHTAVCNA